MAWSPIVRFSHNSLRLGSSSSHVSLKCLYILPRYSTSSAPSPLLSRLREDLKSAMRARDTPRLNVLRGVLADITNSSKTNAPIKDDLALLILLRKRIAATKQAVRQADDVGRSDLVTKEEEQMVILEDYAGNIKTMSDDEIRQIISGIVEQVQKEGNELVTSNIMKKCFGPDGAFEGRMVERQAVARLVKEAAPK
jgi:uncharacterized protein